MVDRNLKAWRRRKREGNRLEMMNNIVSLLLQSKSNGDIMQGKQKK